MPTQVRANATSRAVSYGDSGIRCMNVDRFFCFGLPLKADGCILIQNFFQGEEIFSQNATFRNFNSDQTPFDNYSGLVLDFFVQKIKRMTELTDAALPARFEEVRTHTTRAAWDCHYY